MNFQKLPPVLTTQQYLDMAFTDSRKRASLVRSTRKGSKEQRAKTACLEQIKTVEKVLSKNMHAILEKYPRFEELPLFYQELMRITLDVDQMKKSFASINWCERKIAELGRMYSDKAKKSEKADVKDYYGRISSVMKRMDKHFKVIENARKKMKKYPDIKDMYTVCLVGFPNVGKSTLLSKITKSRPEIKSYSFTTKGLNTGYILQGHEKIQVIDTPGTLNRPDKMNNIERQADLALKHHADLIVFVYDPTFDKKSQILLLNKIERLKKPTLIYTSKTDLAESNIGVEHICDADDLKSRIQSIHIRRCKNEQSA